MIQKGELNDYRLLGTFACEQFPKFREMMRCKLHFQGIIEQFPSFISKVLLNNSNKIELNNYKGVIRLLLVSACGSRVILRLCFCDRQRNLVYVFVAIGFILVFVAALKTSSTFLLWKCFSVYSTFFLGKFFTSKFTFFWGNLIPSWVFFSSETKTHMST